MKRPGKITRRQKESKETNKEVSSNAVDYADIDRRSAIIDAALAALEKQNEEETKQREKIKIEMPPEDKTTDEDKPISGDDEKKAIFTASIADKERELYYTVEQFEKEVLNVEGIVVIVRAAKHSKIRRYTFRKAVSGNMSCNALLNRLHNVCDWYAYEIPGYDRDSNLTINDILVVQSVLHNTDSTL